MSRVVPTSGVKWAVEFAKLYGGGFVLVREDQNEHGYIDTSIGGVFLEESTAKEPESLNRRQAQEQGLVVEDDESDDEWQVSWKLEEHVVEERSGRG